MEKNIYTHYDFNCPKQKKVDYSWFLTQNVESVLLSPLLDISQGLAVDERIGRKIWLESIRFKHTLTLTKGIIDSVNVRFTIVLFLKPPQNVYPFNYFDIPNDADKKILWTPKVEQSSLMRVLYDKVYTIRSKHSFDIEVDGTTVTVSGGGKMFDSEYIHLPLSISYGQFSPINYQIGLYAVSDEWQGLISTQRIILNGRVLVTYRDIRKKKFKPVPIKNFI